MLVRGWRRRLSDTAWRSGFSSREAGIPGFKLPPVRWRIEATFGTLTNRYRRLTRNLEAEVQPPQKMRSRLPMSTASFAPTAAKKRLWDSQTGSQPARVGRPHETARRHEDVLNYERLLITAHFAQMHGSARTP